MNPDQFWRLTLVELIELATYRIDYKIKRQESEEYLIAWQTALLMNIEGKSLKREITPEELLGKDKTENNENKPLTAEDRRNQLEKLKRKFGIND